MCEPCNQLAGRCLEASVQPGEAQCCKPGAGWGVEARAENDPSVSTITEKALTRAATSTFTFKTL